MAESANDQVVQFPTFPLCSGVYEGFIFVKHPGGEGAGFECLPHESVPFHSLWLVRIGVKLSRERT